MAQDRIDAKIPVLKSGYHWCTSYFGEIRTTVGNPAPHTGVDLPGKCGAVDDIICFEDGVVEYARNTIQGYTTKYPAGNYVVIQHSNGYKTRYLHIFLG